jgi:hypothetical protein
VDRLQEGRREVNQDQWFPRLGLNASLPPLAREPSSILQAMGASTRLCLLFVAVATAPACTGAGRNDDGSGSGDEDDSGDPGDDGPPDDATAELGTGTTEFEPLPDESELILVAGPQGGHHFVVHARMRGLDPGDPAMPGLAANPRTRFFVENSQGDRVDVDQAPYRLGYKAVGDDLVLPSGRIVQVLEEEVPSLYGQRVRIDLEVTDANGESASDGRWVVAMEAPAP